ncbi:unnamed protein product [Schistosoma rodhaini]|uniref:SET domain-containing protein n=1 Tax=Schistosoma mansoni TaxID=6183 RepID=A0A3Q0KPL9_SCHMA|nr:unnamed protein product [Schistosoma rodhaini]
MVNYKLNEDCSLKEFDDWLTASSRLHTTYPGRSLLKISNKLKFGQRGLIACCEIKSKQCCYSVPLDDLHLVLTPLRCAYLLNHCPCFEHSKRYQANLNSLDTLIAFMYHCKCSTSTKCILRKIWAPYLSVLPEVYLDPLSCILLDTDCLFERIFTINSPDYFHSNDINIKLKRLLTRLLRSWNCIKPIFTNNNDCTKGLHYKGYDIPPKEFLWAWCTVNSRCVSCPFKESLSQVQHLYNLLISFDLKDLSFCNDFEVVSLFMNEKNNHTISLIPFFDFFNHDQNVPTALSLSKTGLSLELYLERSVSAGEQVLINYGAHDNLTLLTEYGFILPFDEKNTNEVIYLSYRFIMDLFHNLIDSFITLTSSISISSCDSATVSNLVESFTDNQTVEDKFKILPQFYYSLGLYFHQILEKLDLCLPDHSTDNNDGDGNDDDGDDVTWSSVYLSLNSNNNNSGPSYHLGLILFLMYTFISNINNNDAQQQCYQSLDNLYNISENTIYSTIQTLLNRIYTILLEQLKDDREKIVHLMNNPTCQHNLSTLMSSASLTSICLVDQFCKEFLYYFDQRECFIKSLTVS